MLAFQLASETREWSYIFHPSDICRESENLLWKSHRWLSSNLKGDNSNGLKFVDKVSFRFHKSLFIYCNNIARLTCGDLCFCYSVVVNSCSLGWNLQTEFKCARWEREKIVYNRNIIRSVRCWINKCSPLCCHASVQSSFGCRWLLTISSVLGHKFNFSFPFRIMHCISLSSLRRTHKNNCLSLN